MTRPLIIKLRSFVLLVIHFVVTTFTILRFVRQIQIKGRTGVKHTPTLVDDNLMLRGRLRKYYVERPAPEKTKTTKRRLRPRTSSLERDGNLH